MVDSEISLLMQTLVDNVKSHDQVVEVRMAPQSSIQSPHGSQLLSYLMPHSGGLLPLSFGLFHQDEVVRNGTVDLLNQIKAYPVRLRVDNIFYLFF